MVVKINLCNHCGDCSRSTYQCKKCAMGYYMKTCSRGQVECKACKVRDCATCVADGKCTACRPNFGLVKGRCQRCVGGRIEDSSAYCKTCDGNSTFCTHCWPEDQVVVDPKTGQCVSRE